MRLSRPAGPVTTISLEASFQGCRDGDICYPPQSRTVGFWLPAASSAMGEPAAVGQTVREGRAPPTATGQAGSIVSGKHHKGHSGVFHRRHPAGIYALCFSDDSHPVRHHHGEGQRLTTARALWLSLVYVLAMAVTIRWRRRGRAVWAETSRRSSRSVDTAAVSC